LGRLIHKKTWKTLAFSKKLCNNVTGYIMTSKSSSITIRDVAKKAGVSVATVSRYINHNQPVAPDTAERLERVLKELNYVPHATARNLATRKTRIIGLLLADIRADFYAPLLRGIDSVVQGFGYNLIVSSYHNDNGENPPLPIGPHNTDGMLVFADSLGDESIIDLQRRHFPTVLIHRTPPKGVPLPCVTVENKATSCKLVGHLIDTHKCRRIIFLRGPRLQEDSFWREQGYREALKEHGIPIDDGLILEGEFDRLVARDSILNLFNRQADPCDAIFSGDDDAAIGVLDALHTLKRRVPHDIAVIGFDDQNISAYLDPPLTTVRAPTEEVGRKAAQVLFGLLLNEDVDLVTLLPTEIVIRSSCGCSFEGIA
jgi:DNA-binding LacI/PurR family transcriptional regulator